MAPGIPRAATIADDSLQGGSFCAEICRGILCSSCGGMARWERGLRKTRWHSGEMPAGIRADASTIGRDLLTRTRCERMRVRERAANERASVRRPRGGAAQKRAWRQRQQPMEPQPQRTPASSQEKKPSDWFGCALHPEYFVSPGRERCEASRKLANNNPPVAARSFGPGCAS